MEKEKNEAELQNESDESKEAQSSEEVQNKEVNESEEETGKEPEAGAGTAEKSEDSSAAGAEGADKKAGTKETGANRDVGVEDSTNRDDPDKAKKKKKKDKDKLEERVSELEDRVKRQMAEFDNFRKRTEREKSHMYEVGARDVIEKILPVVDSFERGIDSVPEADRDSPFVDGMKKTYRQLQTVLMDLGVTPIEALGNEFDPNFHNAVMHVDDEEKGENVVVEEFQKGYMYRDTVIRHSMVKVAN